MSLGSLFTVDYWFTSRMLVGTNFWILFSIFAAMLLAGIVLDILLKAKVIVKYRGFYRQDSSLLWTMGIMGLIWSFFFNQGIYFLSARVWLIVWFIIIGIWGYFIYKYWRRIRAKYKEVAKRR